MKKIKVDLKCFLRNKMTLYSEQTFLQVWTYNHGLCLSTEVYVFTPEQQGQNRPLRWISNIKPREENNDSKHSSVLFRYVRDLHKWKYYTYHLIRCVVSGSLGSSER